MAAIGHPRLPQQQSIQWIRSRLLPSSWRARFRRVLADAQTSSRRPIDFEPFTRALEAVAEQARLDGKDPVEAITASLKNGALLAKQNKSLQNQSAMLGGEIDRLKRELDTKGKHDLPPIIKIPTNNFFRLGEATIETEFKQRQIAFQREQSPQTTLADAESKYECDG